MENRRHKNGKFAKRAFALKRDPKRFYTFVWVTYCDKDERWDWNLRNVSQQTSTV